MASPIANAPGLLSRRGWIRSRCSEVNELLKRPSLGLDDTFLSRLYVRQGRRLQIHDRALRADQALVRHDDAHGVKQLDITLIDEAAQGEISASVTAESNRPSLTAPSLLLRRVLSSFLPPSTCLRMT